MSETNPDSAVWVQQLVSGDEQVVRQFWSLYGPGLQRLAASRMTPDLQRRTGPDDIVQSVCRTFVRRNKNREYELTGTDSLWRLLCAITLTKVRQHARFHYRQRRSLKREEPLSPAGGDADPPVDHLAAAQPTPDETVQFLEQFEQLLGELTEEERALLVHKVEGRSQQEIAEELGCSERTVRRLLTKLRQRWESQLLQSLDDAAR